MKKFLPLAILGLALVGCGSDASSDTTAPPANPSSTPAGEKANVDKQDAAQGSPIKPGDLTK